MSDKLVQEVSLDVRMNVGLTVAVNTGSKVVKIAKPAPHIVEKFVAYIGEPEKEPEGEKKPEGEGKGAEKGGAGHG